MINFRYHVVSLIAVFFALGMGIIIGSTVLDQLLLDRLRREFDSQSAINKDLRDDVNKLEDRTRAYEEISSRLGPVVTFNRLTEQKVVVLGFESTPDEDFEAALVALGAGNAQVESVLTLSDSLALTEAAQVEAVRKVLGTGSRDVNQVRQILIRRVSESLSGTKPGFFADLVAADLATPRPGQDERFVPPAQLAGSGVVSVLLMPADDSALRDIDLLLGPLSVELSRAESVVGAADGDSDEIPTLAALRDGAPNRLFTVDGITSPHGLLGLVLGIDSGTQGQFGHYGVGEGAGAVLPAVDLGLD